MGYFGSFYRLRWLKTSKTTHISLPFSNVCLIYEIIRKCCLIL
nr:MAG TPA: hypothetical protein [Bacteriophage sp.]